MPGRWVLAVLLSTAMFTEAFAQSERLPLFADDSMLSITIEGPIRRLYRERHERPDLEGSVRYIEDDGTEVVLDVELTARGNTRLELCSFPPVWLNFRRSQLDGTIFEGQNRIKLVTLCRDSNSYRDYLAQEYQIYRAYNAITDHSFRVRWLEVEYIDTERSGSTEIAPAFLIEEDWEVAERHGLEAITVDSISVDQLDPARAALLSVFQYVIGSTDWSPIMAVPGDNCCHNTKLIGPDDSESGRVVLPYDFDQVGLINASFAEPSPALPIRRVTDRLFRGYCVHNDYVPAAVELLIEKRAAVEAAFELLEVRTRQHRQLLQYLEDSYDIISDPEKLREELLDRCRGPAILDGNDAEAG
ncbi:MAG TPA: hypothetical protein VIV14_07095 [Gammaproteobacteria bacterium]